ncbi:NAD(P)/FAD-dependent oxidoreductase [Neobacillus sp. FSL H8-0543]|uniref:NAD(P)/FAD-dependent oxidoreductase n=1 Tax=Neobacillus sp. FSL H8-0543 TaxID=2954672 RepID=UPI003158657B
MEVFDCAVLGAGPAGLNASLVLGRARRKVALFDDGTNRNRVAHESHGFITRDGVKPSDFKKIALEELRNYSSVQFFNETVTQIIKRADNQLFKMITSDERVYYAEKILLATGIQEVFPSVPEIQRFYGKSLFSCPYCHGWELRDQPLIIIVENEDSAVHLAKLVYNWSRDLLVATNGQPMNFSKIDELERRKIMVVTEPIKKLHGEDGRLQSMEFQSGYITKRTGGFILPKFHRPNPFAEQLGCALQENGALVTDDAGRTSQKNIYTAGESAQLKPSSLILAAADGSKVAYAINVDITYERF